MAAQEWYSSGLRFTCTQCGQCCTGAPGYVWCNDDEAEGIAEYLGITVKGFIRRYTHEVDGGRSLNEHRTEHGFDCTFLKRDESSGKALCTIYPVRPAQCRTWPFWGENLVTPQAWEHTKRVCPGTGEGQLYPIENIRILRDRTPQL